MYEDALTCKMSKVSNSLIFIFKISNEFIYCKYNNNNHMKYSYMLNAYVK